MSDRPPLAVRPIEGPLHAWVRVPGSKSITNRALICAAVAEGPSRLVGALFAEDTQAMIDALVQLGVPVLADATAAMIEVSGSGGEVAPGPIELDAHLSGTTSRFLLGMLAIGEGPYLLGGAAPLLARPMADGFAALRALGVEVVEQGVPGHLPAIVHGEADPGVRAVTVNGDVSSQFLSGLLLAAPCLELGLAVTIVGELVSRPYVELTLAVMRSFGAVVEWDGLDQLHVEPTGYRGQSYAIEPDASAASYAFAAAAVIGGDVTVEGIGRHVLQGDVGFLDVLERMGAQVVDHGDAVTVRVADRLRGVEADFTHISDTAQTLAAVAVFADGPTTINGIGFIRAKETDRIAATVTELRRCGIDADELPDGLRVHPGWPHAAVIETYDDHRVAMSIALLGLRVPGIEIADPDVVNKTFPGYWAMLDAFGPVAGIGD